MHKNVFFQNWLSFKAFATAITFKRSIFSISMRQVIHVYYLVSFQMSPLSESPAAPLTCIRPLASMYFRMPHTLDILLTQSTRI